MIKYYDKKMTAKQLAAQLIENQIADLLGYWQEKSSVNPLGDEPGMTEKESLEVHDQMLKYAQRIYKVIEKGLPE